MTATLTDILLSLAQSDERAVVFTTIEGVDSGAKVIVLLDRGETHGDDPRGLASLAQGVRRSGLIEQEGARVFAADIRSEGLRRLQAAATEPERLAVHVVDLSDFEAAAAMVREAIARSGEAELLVALRPDLAAGALVKRLSAPRGKQSFANFLRKAADLSPIAIGLLQEAAIASSQPLASLLPEQLARSINAVPIRLTGVAPIARAISTAGGIAFDKLDDDYMLRKLPGVFAAGEMLDWEAPTGGYLLQASFATGAAAGWGALRWLKR